MKIDRMLFEKFADTVRADETVAQRWRRASGIGSSTT